MKTPKLYAFSKKLNIDLSLSENPLGCSPNVFRGLKKELQTITKYPDPNSLSLKNALARKFRISNSNFVISNGSEDLIDLVCRAFLNPRDEVIVPLLTFPLFEICIRSAGGKPVFASMTDNLDIDLSKVREKITKKTKLVFICNPNNPTGKILDVNKLADFIKDVFPITVVIDEANIEFAGKSIINFLDELKNVIILRTFSKAFGLAGLRIGFLITSKKKAQSINMLIQPFPINSLSQKAAILALEDKKFICSTRQFVDKQRTFLTNELKKLGFSTIDSKTNNILVGVNRLFPSSAEFIKLLNKNNISVVNGNSFRGLNDQFFRISIRSQKINKKFIQVVNKILERR